MDEKEILLEDRIRRAERKFWMVAIVCFVLGCLVGAYVCFSFDTRETVGWTDGYREIKLMDAVTGDVVWSEEYDVKFQECMPELREDIAYSGLEPSKRYQVSVKTTDESGVLVSDYMTYFLPKLSSGRVIVGVNFNQN